MPKAITILEHKKYPQNGCECEIEDLVGLQNYLEKNELTSALHTTANGIQASSWVGVIKYKKQQIQILPKLTKLSNEELENEISNDKIKQILKNLVFMLSYTKKLDIKTTETVNLDCCENPFLEILIREFCTSLFEALRRMSPKNYIREEDNLNFLRGKLKFNENIRYNSSNMAKFYCEYDEFSENNLLNQLFCFVSNCLYRISQDNKNKTVLKQILDYFCDIKCVKFDRFNIKKVKLTRNQSLFEKPFTLARMFVENSSIDLSSNRFENITLLWDMNKLFEEFVYEALRRHQIKGFEISTQKRRRLLRSKNNKLETRRDTKIDIMVNENSSDSVVLDTKYKKFNGLNDVSSADIYQVVTYCRLHNSKKAFIIYPKDSIGKLEPYYLNTIEKVDPIELNFITVDITQDLTKDAIARLANNLIEAIKGEQYD